MKTAEEYATEIVEQVHNGASVSDVIQLLQEYASQFKTVEPIKTTSRISRIGIYTCDNCGHPKSVNSTDQKYCTCKTVEPYRLERPVEDGIAGTELGAVEPDCEHDETPRQGDGFTYFVCSKCGASV